MSYSFGVDTKNKSEHKSVLSTSYGQGIILQFKYRIWKKAKLYVMFGYDQSVTKYEIYNSIFGKPQKFNKFNVLNIHRHGIHLGIYKKFELKKFIIDIGVNTATKNKIHLNSSASSEEIFYDSDPVFKDLSYKILPDYGIIGLEFSANIMYKLNERFSLSAGFIHSTRHLITFESSAKMTDENQLTTFSQTKKYYHSNNFTFINAGIVYKLNN